MVTSAQIPQLKGSSATESRMHWDQAIASTRIEGHEPTPEFLADVQDNINGQLTDEQLIERSIQRGLDAQHQLNHQEKPIVNTEQWLESAVEGMRRMSTDEAYRQEVAKRVYGSTTASN